MIRVLLPTTFAAFYAANIYHSGLSQVGGYLKWGMLGLLTLAAFTTANRQVRKQPFLSGYFLLICFFILAFALTPYSIDPGYSLSRIVGFGITVVVAYKLATIFGDSQGKQFVINLFYAIGAIIASVSISMFAMGINLGRGTHTGRFSGWTDNPNTLGMMLFPLMTVTLYRALEAKAKAFSVQWVLVGVMAILIIATGSRASFLGTVISCAYIFWHYKMLHKLWFFVSLPPLFLIGLYWEDFSRILVEFIRVTPHETIDIGSGRLEVWPLALDAFSQNPYWGYGFSTDVFLLDGMKSQLFVHAGDYFHNSYLSIILQQGLVGATPIIVFLLLNIFKIVRTSKVLLKRSDDLLFSAIILGSLFHAFFETWIFSSGNMNCLILWFLLFLVHMNDHNIVIVNKKFVNTPSFQQRAA